MNENRLAQISAGSQINRDETVRLLRAALSVDAFRFARNLASHWLSVYPGDLYVDTLNAQALLQDGREDLSLPILKRVCTTDPEFLPAQRLLAMLEKDSDGGTAAIATALMEGSKLDVPLPEWAELLSQARLAIKDDMVTIAEQTIHEALQHQPPSPLVAVLHLRLAVEEYDVMMRRSLAEQYLKIWPKCLSCQLVLADALMQGGQEARGMNLLHKAAIADISAQVPVRLWGEDFPYRSLWPAQYESTLPLPIPADVAAALGWNQLEAGSAAPAKRHDPEARQTQGQAEQDKQKTKQKPRKFSFGFKKNKKDEKETKNKEKKANKNKNEAGIKEFRLGLKEIAERVKEPHAASADARFPIYVFFTTRQGLEGQYGAHKAVVIDRALQQAVNVSRNMKHWDAVLVYADEATSTQPFGLPPVAANDPWSLKNFLKDMDEVLRKRGEMIGALQIVGGPQVVPFHRLPNPVDDVDVDVPSDNPYATLDENYFVPSWPVGRLPGSKGNNAQPLIDQINSVAKNRAQSQAADFSLFDWLGGILRRSGQRHSFGYTAEVWRRASNSVYRPIGKPHALVISPPTGIKQIGKYQKQGTKLAYFNLHGLEDGAEWYGQRDPLETPDGEDYPVALRPEDIVNSGRAPEIVFSEACYGANIENKGVEDAISLKFLASGTKAVVGSTCTSYGSITTPLISADLLGKLFWNFLQEGYTAGAALQRAKIEMARQMDKRQGYLDGEDQKTLISFVLYGDPLAQVQDTQPKAKRAQRLLPNLSHINIVCDRVNGEDCCTPPPIPKEVMSQVKGVVKYYLPGMAGSKVMFSQEHVQCSGHDCPTHQIGAKMAEREPVTRRVVTLSKNVTKGASTHTHYARITINKEGKVVKLAVSR